MLIYNLNFSCIYSEITPSTTFTHSSHSFDILLDPAYIRIELSLLINGLHCRNSSAMFYDFSRRKERADMKQQWKAIFNCCLIIFVCCLLNGCAFLIKGVVPEPVQIASIPSGATCEVYNKLTREKISTLTTPTTILLEKSRGYFKPSSYQISCILDKQQPQEALIEGSISGWYWGNLAFGGLIGMLLVDPASGAMWTLEPDTVLVNYEDPSKSILNGSSYRITDRGFRTRENR